MLFLALGAGAFLACAPPDGDPADSEESPGWFTEATLSPTFQHNRAVWAGVAMLDFDADGWTDLFFTNGKGETDGLYRNLGDGSFEDVAESVGITDTMESGAAVAGDLDNDGDPDLVVSASCSTGSFTASGGPLADGQKVIYRNDGGQFTEEAFGDQIAFEGGTDTVAALCTVSLHLADVNNDGFLDLFLGNSVDPDLVAPWVFRKGDANSTDWLFLNDGAGNFPHAQALPTYIGTTFTFITADLDGDTLPETIAGRSGWPMEELQWPRGGQVPPTADLVTNDAGLWMGIAPADYDRDGDLDMYVTNQGLSTLLNGYDNTVASEFPDGVSAYLFHSLFENDGTGAFTRTTWSVDNDGLLAGDLFEGLDGTETQYADVHDMERYPWGWGVVALDVDADGWEDVAYTGNACAAPMSIIWTEDRGAGPGALLLNEGGAGFADVTWEAGVANLDAEGRYPDGRGIAVGDLNNDGFADLVYVNKSYNPTQSDPLAQELGVPHVWLSKPRDAHWLKLHLVGTTSSRDALGSLVYVTDSRGTTVHAYAAGGGTNTSSETSLLLGLGQDESVDLEIRFPSGSVTHLEEVAADQRLEVTEE